jgi:hypothetical protein
MSEEFGDRIRRSVERVPVPEPAPVEHVALRARRIRVRRYLSGAVTAAVVIGAGIGVPAGLLSSLNDGRPGAPAVAGSGAATAPLPDVADIVCDGTTTEVLTPQVRPQSDGVHFRVNNTSGQDLAIEFARGEFFAFGGTNADQGTHEIDFHDVPPGEAKVRCLDAEQNSGSHEGYVPLEVVDQDGVWGPDQIQCDGDAGVVGHADYVPGAEGPHGDPVDIFRAAHTEDLQPGDEVRPGAYPDSQSPKVSVIRSGIVVAVAEYYSDGSGGWLESTYSKCAPPGGGGSGGGSSGSSGSG